MDTKKLQLIPRTIEAVQLTDENMLEVRDWVQLKTPFQQVVGTEKKLYLPSAGQYVDILVPGDWVFYDEQDDAFRGAENSAVQGYYMEVPE